jgi:DNA-binding NarL/FixJ family response regulator
MAGKDDPLCAPARLPRRTQPVLRGLLDGHSEKRVARDLRLSPHTVHEYVKLIYRAYGVTSRAELIVQCLRRQRDREE